MAQLIFRKPLKEITAKDRYIYEQMPKLPVGVILIDLENDKNTRYGELPISETAISELVRFTKDVVKECRQRTTV